MIDKNGAIITQIARSGAALSMLVVLASCGGGQTTEQKVERRMSIIESSEAHMEAWKAAIAGRPQPSDAGARFPFQLDEAAKEAPFLIEAMWSDRFFTYIRTNAQTRIYMSTGLSATVVPITRTEDPNLLLVQGGVRVGGQLRIGNEIVKWRYIRTEAAP